MMEWRGSTLVGRHEPLKDESPFLWSVVLRVNMACQATWARQNVDDPDGWDAWNVMACVGTWGRWHSYDLLELKGLGTHPTPHVACRWRFDQRSATLTELEVPADPPVVHLTSALLHNSTWPVRLRGTLGLDPKSRLQEIERHLDELCLPADAWAQTRSGVGRVLAMRRLELVPPMTVTTEGEPASASWTLRPLSRPSPGSRQREWRTLQDARSP